MNVSIWFSSTLFLMLAMSTRAEDIKNGADIDQTIAAMKSFKYHETGLDMEARERDLALRACLQNKF